MMRQWLSVSTALLAALFLIYQAESCNEAVCGSVVSKCLLTQSCKCDLENCTCCKECFNCLSYLYSECCSCVDMCPKPNETDNLLSKKSHVEDISEKVAGLFKVLTETPDPERRWNSITFPIDFNVTNIVIREKEIKLQIQSIEQEVIPDKPMVITRNCTVAYMTQCMSWQKCKNMCISMGATSYRWFHDGCCECVGDDCLNYGISESRCWECSEMNRDEMSEELEDLDFGEDYDDDI